MITKKLNILWLKTGSLHPLNEGGRIRTYNMLKELKKRHQITYIALCPPEIYHKPKETALEYCHESMWVPCKESTKFTLSFYVELIRNTLFSRLPYAIEKYRSAEMSKKIKEITHSRKFDLIVCDFLAPSININGTLSAPTLLFQHNVEYLIWKRLCENSQGLLKRSYFALQSARMFKYEMRTCRRFDAVVGVSNQDCHLMNTKFGLHNIIGVVPTGVDLSYFCPMNVKKNPKSIVFLGSMDWLANIDAVIYFTENIYPLMKRDFPDISFTIVGKNPPQSLKHLAKKDKSICVTGTVTDVRPYLARTEVMVVPLRIGGGTRTKIYEAMAMGIPVVSTRIGAEGLTAKNGNNILVADSPEKFAHQVSNLLNQRQLRIRIAKNGLSLVRGNFSWESVTKSFEQLCLELYSKKACL